MSLIEEHKKQVVYILIGATTLLFPFFDIKYLILAFFGAGLIFLRISPESSIFNLLAREAEFKAGKLKGYIQLFFTIGLLLFLGSLFDFDRFPLFIIGAAF